MSTTQASPASFVPVQYRAEISLADWLDGWRPNGVTGERELVGVRHDETRPHGHDPFHKCGDETCGYCYRVPA